MQKPDNLFNKEDAEIIMLNPGQKLYDMETEGFWYKEGDETKINRQQFLSFLEKRGFRKYYIGKDYMFVQVENNIVKEVGTVQIKDYVTSYIKSPGESITEGFNSNTILSKVINQAPTLFSRNFLEFIPNLEGEFKRDTEEESYIYYNNCFVKVTKDRYETHPYIELEGYIWESQKHRREFYISEEESVFEVFIYRVCREEIKRYNSLRSAIGYLLHSYKDPANAKAIIFIDERPGDGANGRCGKSLVGKAIGKIRNSVRPDGKNFKFRQFMFQSVKPDTAIIDFNDAQKNFPFENLFSIITDDMAIEKKNKDEIIIQFEYSPKILISTNHAIKGADASTLDREFVLEFSDHYNENNKPVKEFGKKFFKPFWNKGEWNCFDNFMIGCLQFYLRNNLVDYERINLTTKMLIESTSEEFVEFMEEIELGNRYDKKELHQKFVIEYEDHKNLPQKTFTSWIRTYAKLKGYKYEAKKSGSDRSFVLINDETGQKDEGRD